MNSPRQPVLLYDGGCGLCNRIIWSLLKADRAGRLHYAPLQSAPAQAYLRAQGLPVADFDSLVFVPDWNRSTDKDYLLRTDGVLAACAEVGGGWRVLAWLRIVPRALRDPFYKVIARSRYTLFGEYRPTPLPDPDWERRFLAR